MPEGQRAAGIGLAFSTARANRTGFAVASLESSSNNGSAVVGQMRHPSLRVMTSWTGHDLLLPINGKTSEVISLFIAGLPTGVGGYRANEVQVIRLLATDNQVSIDISGINQMFVRQ